MDVKTTRKAKDYKPWGSVTVRGQEIQRPSLYVGSGANLLFLASMEKVKEQIGNKDLVPASLSPSKALIGITIFDFSYSPVGPYTELVITVPVFYKPRFLPPLLSIAVYKLFKNFGFYVLDIFQSTEIGIEHGNVLTGYPHNPELIDIDFIDNENEVDLSVKSTNGEKILSVQAEVSGKGKRVEDSHATFFKKDKKVNKIRMDIHGMKRSLKKVNTTLGSHKVSKYLEKLGVSLNSPIQSEFYREVIEVNPVKIDEL